MLTLLNNFTSLIPVVKSTLAAKLPLVILPLVEVLRKTEIEFEAMNYVRTVSANPYKAIAGLLVLALFGLMLAFTDSWTVVKLMFGVVSFWFLFRKPELALAIQFNGVALYLYAIYKLRLEASTVGTGTFYGVMALAYLAGGIHLAVGRRALKLNKIDALFVLLYSLFFKIY